MIERIVERNLLVPNSLLRLPIEIGCVLAGGALMTSEPTTATEGMIVDGLVSLVQGKMSGGRHFLMIGHDAWQPHDRIVMYNKLWRSMERRVSLPAGKRSDEFKIETEKGVKFFGFHEWDGLDPQQVLNLLRSETACTLVAVERSNAHDVLAETAARGWEKSGIYYPPPELLRLACRERAVVYETIGTFDDRERGLAVVARPPLIDQIFDVALP